MPNFLSDSLHGIINEKNIPPAYNPIELKFFDTETKTNRLSAYHFHPDRIGFWSTIANILKEFFTNKTAILVKVDIFSDPLYVKVADLSQILGINKKILTKEIKGMNADEVSSYIKMEASIKKIQDHLEKEILSKGQILESLLTLSKAGIGLEDVVALIQEEDLSSKKMVNILMKLGEKLKSEKSLENSEEGQVIPESKSYRFNIINSNICIMGINEKGNDFQIDPKSFHMEISGVSDKVQELALRFNLSTNNAYRNLNALAKKISYHTIENLLEEMKTEDDKRVMLNTLIHVGQDIRINPEAQFYIKETKTSNQLETHAYGISENHIFIAISQLMGGKLGNGTFKLVNSAYKIDNFAGQQFSAQVEDYVRIKPNPEVIKEIGLAEANKSLSDESNAMDVLKDNPYAVEPHLFQAYSSTGKIVLFQKKCDGDGEKLFQANIHHQLNALKEFGMGLDLLHKKNLVHMDVKPPNLFIVGDINDKKTPVKGKVADIGLLIKKGALDAFGSPFYLPPEALLINNNDVSFNPLYRADESLDSYSYGITIFEIILPQSVEAIKQFFFQDLEVPFFGGVTDPSVFQENVEDCLQFVCDAISQNPTQENLQRLKMLAVCRNLIQFDPKNRLSCGEAAKSLENIQLGIV